MTKTAVVHFFFFSGTSIHTDAWEGGSCHRKDSYFVAGKLYIYIYCISHTQTIPSNYNYRQKSGGNYTVKNLGETIPSKIWLCVCTFITYRIHKLYRQNYTIKLYRKKSGCVFVNISYIVCTLHKLYRQKSGCVVLHISHICINVCL